MDGRQRCAQFMRCHGDEARLQVVQCRLLLQRRALGAFGLQAGRGIHHKKQGGLSALPFDLDRRQVERAHFASRGNDAKTVVLLDRHVLQALPVARNDLRHILWVDGGGKGS